MKEYYGDRGYWFKNKELIRITVNILHQSVNINYTWSIISIVLIDIDRLLINRIRFVKDFLGWFLEMKNEDVFDMGAWTSSGLRMRWWTDDNRIIPAAISSSGFLNPGCTRVGEWIVGCRTGCELGELVTNAKRRPTRDGRARTFRYVISSLDSRRARTYVRYCRAILDARTRSDDLKIPVASNWL